MAELAIPILALGGLFVMSQQPNPINEEEESATEGYENMGRPTNELPNYTTPSVNYPKTGAGTQSNKDLTREYVGAGNTAETYFDQNNRVQQERFAQPVKHINQIKSLSGDDMSRADFRHNNMVPFFGGKTTGQHVNEDANQSVLDNAQGSGSLHMKKVETAPLFNPGDNVQWSHGAPNQSDFMQSRVNESMYANNTQPFESVRVAPGLNQGAGTEGHNGFNSGMVGRESWKPPTVDELRVKSNPKISYDLAGHEGPAMSKIVNLGTTGRIEKNRPDTDFVNSADRWLTTTAAGYSKPTASGIQEMPAVNRTDAFTDYYGVGGDHAGASYNTGEYEASHRQASATKPIINAAATNRNTASANDYNVEGHTVPTNNRTTVVSNTEMGGSVGGVVSAMFAPILDVLRPSRKTNVMGNARESGNVGVSNAQRPELSRNEWVATTNREMNVDKLGTNHWNYQGQGGDGYKVLDVRLDQNNRNSTNTSYAGISGGSGTTRGKRQYDADYRQRNNMNKNTVNRANQGGTQMFNQSMNITVDKHESDRNNTRSMYPSSLAPSVPSIEQHGNVRGPQFIDPNQSNERMDPNMLSAFKANPYTHSLQSW